MLGSPFQNTSDLLWDLRLFRKYAGSQGLCWGQATSPRTERKAGRRSHYLTERPTWNSPGGKKGLEWLEEENMFLFIYPINY